MKRRIAFFDFDGTVTTKDTLLEIIRHVKGTPAFYAGFLLYSPFLVAYKLKVISNQLAKEMVLRFFFGKTPVTKFQQYCDDFADHVLPSLLRPKALHEIRRLQEAGATVVIVSASASNWINGWCNAAGVQLLATKLEEKNNAITGMIEGRNCHGNEKVRRIREAYNLEQYDEIYCYGDTSGDKPMLSLATHPFYKPFR